VRRIAIQPFAAPLSCDSQRLRDEYLNTNCFLSLADAKCKIEAWRQRYDESRPHTSLGFVPSSAFA